MKRSRLKADPDKVREFVQRGRQASQLKRSELARSSRKRPRATRSGIGVPVGTSDRCTPSQWYAAKAAWCATCKSTGLLQQHHVVYEQHVVRAGGDVWDPRNSLTLCVNCHQAHHGRYLVVGTLLLRDETIAFAADTLGDGAAYEYLRRIYRDADVDPRVAALISPATGSSGTPMKESPHD